MTNQNESENKHEQKESEGIVQSHHVHEQNTEEEVTSKNQNNQYEEEFSADAPAINPHEISRSKVRQYDKRTNMSVRAQHGWGWLAVGVAIISLFTWTIFFALVGTVLGVYAIRRNSVFLGNTAIVLAIFSVLFRLMLNPII